MNYDDIEGKARDLQVQIWRDRSILLPGRAIRPLDVLEPELAASVLNVEFEYCNELGRFGSGRERFEVAGMIDRHRRKISVAMTFRQHAIRFTGAHEIAHWVLHSDEVMHRDRPIEGVTGGRSPRPVKEQEADYFAACFLVPRKLAFIALENTFLTNGPLVLNDDSAFFLRPDNPDFLLSAGPESWDLATAVASATSYGGRHFTSLASQFRVSVATMAIRLRELNLIAA